IEEFCLRQDSAGPGTWRGGLGFEKQYVILAPCKLWANFDRVGCPPWGVQGGKEAKAGQVLIIKKGTQEPQVIYKTENFVLGMGDRVRVATGGGGGYGPPSKRPIELVERDVLQGYVSSEKAREDYGVVVESNGKAYRL
nr:hydantoinase B/oxoprolinase family protein [Deltaproteobacteria bacterium]